MKICVVGANPETEGVCRAVLQHSASGDWELIYSGTQEEPLEADAYIWDCGEQNFPSQITPETAKRSLFVVEANGLELLRNALGAACASIVLKPVRPEALRPFLDHSLRHGKPKDAAESSPISTPFAGSDGVFDLFQCLLHTKLKLQESDRRQACLITDVLRDIRTPLSLLSGYCGILMDQQFGALHPDHMELLSKLQHGVGQVLRRTETIRELTQPMKSDPDLPARDVEATMSQAILEVTPLAERKDVRIAVQLEPPQQGLRFDPARINHVLVSVLEKACKVTPKGLTVEVSGYPVFWNGHAPRTSQPMSRLKKGGLPGSISFGYRIDIRAAGAAVVSGRTDSVVDDDALDSDDADRPAEGLAMAICRMVVSAHRGSIWAETSAEATQFSLVLPDVKTDDARPASEAVFRKTATYS